MTEDKGKQRGRGRPKSVPDVAQRELIADAALEIFRRQGYRNTAMKDVAACAHVSLATIYRLFPAKSELFGAIVARHRRFMIALPGVYDHMPIDEALMAIFRVDINSEEARLRDDVMSMIILASGEFPELRPILHRYGPEHSRTLLHDWLDVERRAGRIRTEDTGVLAKMLMDIAFGAPVLKTGADPAWPGDRDRSAYLRSCFSMIADGISTL